MVDRGVEPGGRHSFLQPEAKHSSAGRSDNAKLLALEQIGQIIPARGLSRPEQNLRRYLRNIFVRSRQGLILLFGRRPGHIPDYSGLDRDQCHCGYSETTVQPRRTEPREKISDTGTPLCRSHRLCHRSDRCFGVDPPE
ncbi:hypothetical protein [Sphingomonas sp. ERG5]|uniref:hypothetical protein n=1 Tax=Sphingomonas sp. ERG5 TaxID=1381597 RepID=UPI001269B24A|nr:hypothetical protein [Sphingomonas sp. ERG5]